MPSNCVIINGDHVELTRLIAAGFTVSNYIDDGEPHFSFSTRKRTLKNFVVHETCGNTAKGCKNTLVRKGYGVQLILSEDAHLSCHGDLAQHVMIHANQLNGVSIGMEVVNPYTPLYARQPFTNFIPAQWWTWVPSASQPDIKAILDNRGLKAVPNQYCTPTDRQMQAARILVPEVCELLGITYQFPTSYLGPAQRKIQGWNSKPAAVPGPGVVAHRDFASHADGRYMLEDLIAQGK